MSTLPPFTVEILGKARAAVQRELECTVSAEHADIIREMLGEVEAVQRGEPITTDLRLTCLVNAIFWAVRDDLMPNQRGGTKA